MDTGELRDRLVRVHVNLHLQRLAVKVPPAGRITGYVDDITLADPVFTVQPAGQARCQETQVRAVCAWVTGRVIAVDTHPETGLLPLAGWRQLRFDPRRHAAFMDGGQPVRSAACVICAGLHAWVSDTRAQQQP